MSAGVRRDWLGPVVVVLVDDVVVAVLPAACCRVGVGEVGVAPGQVGVDVFELGRGAGGPDHRCGGSGGQGDDAEGYCGDGESGSGGEPACEG